MNPQHYPQFIHKMWIMLRKLVLNIQNNVDKKKIGLKGHDLKIFS